MPVSYENAIMEAFEKIELESGTIKLERCTYVQYFE